MKLCVVVLLMTIGLSSAVIEGNGEPGCKTATEITVKYYRNVWDSTVYWICDELGQPAKRGNCPVGTGWMDSIKGCIDWENWKWEDTVEPPSKP